MMLKPLYPYLSNSMITDKGLEYFSKSKKAFSIAHLINADIRESKAYGFLFTGVESITQKPKNENIAKQLGILDSGMLHFIYSELSDNKVSSYVIHSDYSFIIVKAENVQLIEDVVFM